MVSFCSPKAKLRVRILPLVLECFLCSLTYLLLMVDIKNNLEKILSGEIKLQYCASIRKHILLNNIFDYKCNKCGIHEWMGQKITLEIEHKDGDNWNNKKENLEFLCPNCHSLTSTFRKKKNKKQKNIISDEEIIEALKNNKNINQTLVSLGMDNSGGNYKRVIKICQNNKIEIPKIKREKIKKESEYNKKLTERINNILKANIDFTQRGWRLKVEEVTGIQPQRADKFIVKYFPELKDILYKHKDKKEG